MQANYMDLDEIKSLMRVVEGIGVELRELDLEIKRYADALELIQPYAPGKISVRTISLTAGRPEEPTFVAWKWTPEGRNKGYMCHYDILKTALVTRSIKWYGPFKGTQDDVRFLIEKIKCLIERRKSLKNIMAGFSRAVHPAIRASRSNREKASDALLQETIPIHKRHTARVAEWRVRKAAKEAEAAARNARFAIPDPEDYDFLDLPPPPKKEDDPRAAQPDSYLDENGEYVGP